jgi:hypothetical protein
MRFTLKNMAIPFQPNMFQDDVNCSIEDFALQSISDGGDGEGHPNSQLCICL